MQKKIFKGLSKEIFESTMKKKSPRTVLKEIPNEVIRINFPKEALQKNMEGIMNKVFETNLEGTPRGIS